MDILWFDIDFSLKNIDEWGSLFYIVIDAM